MTASEGKPHEMCLERRDVLCRINGQSEYMAFADDLDFMPDIIWASGRRFKYGGVSDGRGFYREEIDSIHSADCELIVHCYHPDSTCTCRQTSDDMASGAEQEAQRLLEVFAPDSPISVCLHGIPHRYPCEDCVREDLERAGADGSDMIGDDTPVEELKAEWADRERAGTKNPAQMVQDFISSALAAGEPLERIFGSVGNPPFSLDSMHETDENATPNPRMQYSRCSELLDLVSQMIENPPGLSGIRCHLGHVGNHYVDAGWVEALTRVKWHLVTGGSGTREEI